MSQVVPSQAVPRDDVDVEAVDHEAVAHEAVDEDVDVEAVDHEANEAVAHETVAHEAVAHEAVDEETLACVALGKALANSLIAPLDDSLTSSSSKVSPSHNFARRNSQISRLAIGRSASTLSWSSPIAPIISASPLLSTCPSIILPLLAGVLVDKVGRLATIDTSLKDLTDPQAMQIGRSFRMALDVSDSAEEALNKWSAYYPSVSELMEALWIVIVE
jgi:hypothetical protein